MNKQNIIRRALRAGPATSYDIAAATGFPLRYCSAVLHKLWTADAIDRTAVKAYRPGSPGAYIYSRKTMRLWTTAEVRTLGDMSSARRRDIARRLGRSQRAVVEMARRVGVRLHGPLGGRHDPATVRRVRELREQGKTVRGIARDTGIPLGTIRHWLYERVRRSA